MLLTFSPPAHVPTIHSSENPQPRPGFFCLFPGKTEKKKEREFGISSYKPLTRLESPYKNFVTNQTVQERYKNPKQRYYSIRPPRFWERENVNLKKVLTFAGIDCSADRRNSGTICRLLHCLLRQLGFTEKLISPENFTCSSRRRYTEIGALLSS